MIGTPKIFSAAAAIALPTASDTPPGAAWMIKVISFSESWTELATPKQKREKNPYSLTKKRLIYSFS